MSENEEEHGRQTLCLILLLAFIFGGLGIGAGYSLGRAHQQIETLEVKKTLETYKVIRGDKERIARHFGKMELDNFRQRVIGSQPYVQLLRNLSVAKEEVRELEESLGNE